MQKPFKLSPEFSRMLAAVLAADPEAWAALTVTYRFLSLLTNQRTIGIVSRC